MTGVIQAYCCAKCGVKKRATKIPRGWVLSGSGYKTGGFHYECQGCTKGVYQQLADDPVNASIKWNLLAMAARRPWADGPAMMAAEIK